MSQIQEMIKPAAAMLDTYPVVTTKQKIKQWIKTCVPGMTPEKAERYSWPQALLAMGLLQAYEQTKDKTALSSVFSYLRRWKNSGYPISHVDHVMNGSVALWTEEILTREKREDAESLEALWICREGADICAGWIKAAKKTADGILAYRSQHPDWLFADTLGMLCPFACRYGVQKQDKELLNLGIRQLELFFQKGMDEKTGLPYHGYDEKIGMKYGIIGWGRACGWMLLGLSQSILWISEQPAGAEQAEQSAACPSSRSVAREGCNRLLLLQQQLLDSVFAWQRPDGGFSWQLQAQEGHRDTSAEGMIGYSAFLAAERAAVQRSEQWIPALSRLAAIMQTSIQKGYVTDCSGECKGFAEYPQVYGTYPWGSGSALAFLAGKRFKEESKDRAEGSFCPVTGQFRSNSLAGISGEQDEKTWEESNMRPEI